MILETVGVIMDGNRRWAKAKGLPVFLGHEEGYQTFKKFLGWAKELGVKNVVAFAFSLENWQRTLEEVAFLIDLIRKLLREEVKELLEQKARIIFAGDISKFPKDIFDEMRKLEKESAKNTNFTLTLCVSYSGRAEIVKACNELLVEGKKEITIEDISKHTYTKDIPDADIIIRTSGEERLSSFLLWQSTYSELFFTNTLWPDFSKEEFENILEEYKNRERRIGK